MCVRFSPGRLWSLDLMSSERPITSNFTSCVMLALVSANILCGDIGVRAPRAAGQDGHGAGASWGHIQGHYANLFEVSPRPARGRGQHVTEHIAFASGSCPGQLLRCIMCFFVVAGTLEQTYKRNHRRIMEMQLWVLCSSVCCFFSSLRIWRPRRLMTEYYFMAMTLWLCKYPMGATLWAVILSR